MKPFILFEFIITLLLVPEFVPAQKADTIKIDASTVNTKFLIPGIHHYLVYSKNGKDSSRKNYQFWTRKIEFIKYNERDAISVTQEWENNDTILHKSYAVCDRKTFAPLFHQSWFKQRGYSEFDFAEKKGSIQNKALQHEDTATTRRKALEAFETALEQFVLDWHLDLEVFPILPYKENRTFLINFYDPGLDPPRTLPYTVIGSSKLVGYNGQQIDCWLLNQPGKTANETFWISKQTHEVLKLEQEFGGRYRYKIKLPFSG